MDGVRDCKAAKAFITFESQDPSIKADNTATREGPLELQSATQ